MRPSSVISERPVWTFVDVKNLPHNTNIVFLWAEVIGYVKGVLDELRRQTEGTIDVIYWDKRNINSTRYDVGSSNVIGFHPRSRMDEAAILTLLRLRKPEIVVISGWMDDAYIGACRRYKKESRRTKIVAGIDDQWTGSLRQHLGRWYFRFFYRSLFDYLWVSGKPQFSFAQRFGYGIEHIISNLYSADTTIFNQRSAVSRRFLFVGRFVKIKALDQLINAYCMLSPDQQREWPLVLIGDGDQKTVLEATQNPNVKLVPFLQPDALMDELRKGGVGCLTSHLDQWGVVIHENALMGLPLLVSSGCGAVTEFLIPGYNGFMFKRSDVASLHQALDRFCHLTDAELSAFAERSRQLGQRINNEVAAASLLSVVYL